MPRKRKRKRSAWAAVSGAVRAVATAASSVVDAARSVPVRVGNKRIRKMFGRKPPRVKHEKCPEGVCGVGGWKAKYDPKTHTVRAAQERRMPRKLRKALRAHEVSHGMVCDRTSKSGLRKCTYNGDHGPRYYRTAAKVHRALGTDPEAALELERRSGYKPPRSFARALRRGTARKRRG